MKLIKYLLLSSVLIFSNCTDVIEVEPQSYIVDNGDFTLLVAQNLLLGAYASMRAPKETEWALTEVLSDNTYNNVTSTSDLRRLQVINYDTFNYDNSDRSYYLGPYWLASYTSIRAANTVIEGVGYTYEPSSQSLNFSEIKIAETSAKTLAAEACFIRAYNYFNLVRMFGSIPLVYVPFETPRDAYTLPNASVEDVYKLIIADLKFAVDNGISENYSPLTTNVNIGKANKWAAAALLAKVYLTLGDKASAKTQLESIIGTTVATTGIRGYGLETSYASVFSTSNEMNKEILFSIRYSNANTTVGNSFTESFAGVGQTTPNSRTDNGVTEDLYNAYSSTDTRRNVTILKGATPTGTGTAGIQRYFLTKFYSAVTVAGLGPNDWPVIRYSDVLLMYAEALGNTPTAVQFINLVRTRASATAYSTTMTNADFEENLFKERRLELAGENQRMFDLLRRNSTTTTGFNLKTHFINYFTNAFPTFYQPDLIYPLSFYIDNINKTNFLLVIPATQTQS
ncbi:RagB/SusD family nutrient uptake outer membrane protein [Flavobacterium sp. NG2]|uniref:RagB/SusD family nutrient uptake outer membrane protein n=1 Tax=Flavobacterium sp. NG2 TaxID=3097547 RepID=UPI002A7F7ADD|nr:RagB/SusD family nutrient uptake outer membrane protein [Flavobacterium sp. NG2]WPR71012.1 RagB/SusD family nutrient uptake outer membrane protein [Flavobacterium sp. NG2]